MASRIRSRPEAIPGAFDKADGAARVRRFREQSAQIGCKQLCVMLPIELHPQFKAFAARVRAGAPADSVAAELFHVPGVPSAAEQLRQSLEELPTWRRWLLRQLLPGDCSDL